MSRSYLLTMRPLESYFFGNEKTFSFDPKSPADNRYFIKSERMPLQTTVLGTLRYLLMPVKNAGYSYSSEERMRNAAVIGPDSFMIGSTVQSFGAIKKIHPLFLLHGERKYVRTPFDHCPGVKEKYQPMEGKYLDDTQGILYFPDYDAKKGIQDSYMCVDDATLVPSETIFTSTVRVGVAKGAKEKGFYKRQFAGLRQGWAFGAYVELDEQIIDSDPDAQKALDQLKAGTVAYLGQNKSAFAVSLQAQENTVSDLLKKHLKKGRVYCFADTLAKAEVYQSCALAATMLRDYRAYMTRFVEDQKKSRYVGRVQKDACLYKLLSAGSILIPLKDHDLSPCLSDEQCRQIGFNVTILNTEE